MKKLFLIPLMTLMCSVMAFAAVRTAGTLTELQSALAAAEDGDEIQLTADIALPSDHSVYLNIKKSITLDGQGHTLSGYGNRGSAQQTIAINYSNSEKISVVLKNLNITTPGLRPIDTRGNLISLELDNVNIVSTATSGNAQGITFSCDAGADASIADLIIKNSSINATASGYPIIFWNPANVIAENSTFAGYCGMYFKSGSAGSIVNADACNFDAPNIHSGKSNAFAVFPMEETSLTFNLNNCGMNAEQIGDQGQPVFCLSEWTKDENRAGQVNITLSGDNTHINCESEWIWNSYWYPNTTGTPDYNSIISTAEATLHVNVNAQITGGTYSVDPREMVYWNDQYKDGEGYHYSLGHITIPEGYEVKEIAMEGVATPLYRVVKKAQEKEPGVMYDLNDYVPVEGQGYGDNPVSSFDLSTGTEMELNQETTTAGYVQVSDNGDDATIIKVGKVEDAGTPEETKVDQTLVINNGLDVQGESQVIVQAGSTVQIGEGGINTEKPENIVIEANENGAASLLLDPTITVNQTPNLTVRMTAKQIGRDANNDYFWHRFAMPVASIASWDKEGGLGEGNDKYPTYLYAWNYATNDWASIAPNAMEPLMGYTLTLASEYIDGAATDGHLNVLQDVVYTFKGNLVGNTDQPLNFQHEGFNFFGNSYTGYMHVKTVLQGIADEKIDATAYMWCNDPDDDAYQTYVGTSLYKLIKNRGLEEWQKEVSPMQTFILRLRGADSSDSENINYAAAIWGNPRYGNGSSSPAPRRVVASVNEDTYMEIAVKAANGKGSRVDFTESADNSDAFESGYDVEKYMNEKTINLYATVNGLNLSSVVTNNIEGKTLSLQTNGEIAYTMSFKNIEGTEYAIRDNATNQVIAIEEGATYEFAAQPNTTIEGRFEIVAAAKVPTAIENAAVKANAKGIYTIMGQYLGEDFNALPAGVYVVDGVKIVK